MIIPNKTNLHKSLAKLNKDCLKQAKFETKPTIVDGKFCSKCGQEASVCMDEDWDFVPGMGMQFVTIPYLYCENCKERLK